jgi:NAD(P)-dependent dehydrogenase (short-subunit alcohol dehydrogenase family)
MKVTVTGAAGGIGRATVETFVSHGYQVLAVDLPGERLDLLSSLGAQTLACDLSNEADRDRVVEHSAEMNGLVNCAGIIIMKPLLEFTLMDIRKIFQINFEAAWDLTSRIGREMPQGSSIVNLSSTSSKYVSNSQVGPYAATKSAINSLTRTFAFEFADRGVRVNAIAPGIIDTPMQEQVVEELAAKHGRRVEDLKNARLNLIPMKRAGTPTECAELITFLISDKSSYITGQVINVDGGWVTY